MTAKLDTAEGVLEWARTADDIRAPDCSCCTVSDVTTAAYLAECVRLRQAFELVLEEAREDAKDYAEVYSRTPR